MGNNAEKNDSWWVGIIKATNSPLGFFVLTLLIIEGFLAIILKESQLSSDQKFWGMLIGVFLFLLVIVIVAILVWCKPQNLTFAGSDHIQYGKIYGTSENPKTKVEAPGEKPIEHT
jgi:hypothetical protein